MSYAEAAARGPKQSPEDVADQTSKAPQPPQIERTEDVETNSTVDVDSMHVHSVPSNYSGETDTQMNRMEHEAEDAEKEAKERFRKFEDSASKEYSKRKSVMSRKGKDAKDAFMHAENEAWANRDNPVVIGNVVLWTAVTATLGFGAYQQHQAGKLDWRMGGIWAGAVGLFATGDYFVSRYFFKKYPPK